MAGSTGGVEDMLAGGTISRGPGAADVVNFLGRGILNNEAASDANDRDEHKVPDNFVPANGCQRTGVVGNSGDNTRPENDNGASAIGVHGRGGSGSEFTALFGRPATPPVAVVIGVLGAAGAPATCQHTQTATSDETAPMRLGEYRIIREVARGGMGIVYEAVQESLGRHVALKVLPFQSLGDTTQRERFRREAQAAAKLHHSNIVPVFGVGEHDGSHYFAMQFIKGQPLNRVVHELKCRRRSEAPETEAPFSVSAGGPKLELTVTLAEGLRTGRFPDKNEEPRARPRHGPSLTFDPYSGTGASHAVVLGDRSGLWKQSGVHYFRSVARVGVQVAEALAYAHRQGILHRDIKPSNLLLDTQGIVWITDFGLAKEEGTDELTSPGDLLGTLRYMAPERFRGQADVRSDIYSLGLTLYEIATLRPAFAAPERAQLIERMLHDEPTRPRQLDCRIPRDLETMILKAIAKEPARRYQAAGELAEDLQRFLADRPIQARRARWPEQFGRLCRRNPLVTGLMVAVAALLVVAIVILEVSNVMIRHEQAQTKGEKDRAEKALKLAENRADEIRQGLAGLKAADALLERGQVYFEWRRWDDADAALTRAIQLRPDHSALWTARSDLYIRLGLWDVAASDIAKAFELREPDESQRWHGHALLRLYVGDRNGYRQVCVRMHDRFHGATDAEMAMVLVRTCLLVPDFDTDPAALLELAQEAAVVPRHAWYLYALGIAHYRAGQYEQAVERLRESLGMGLNWHAKGINYPILAMAYYKLGRKAQAWQALEDATRAIDRWTMERYENASGNWVEHQGATGFWPIFWSDEVECRLYYREARALIGLPPPADDPRMHILRGRAFAGLRWPDKAAAEYAAALQLSPHDPGIQQEVHRNRGVYHVKLCQWHQAAVELTRASELQPNDAFLWHFRAVAHLAAGDRDPYRRICAGMLERFRKTQDPVVAYQVVATCLLRQDALPDLDQLLPVAEVAARWYPGSIRVLAAANYRAGHFEQAVDRFEKAARVYRFRAWDWCFLAMAQHRLGRAEEARQSLAKAREWIDHANRQKLDDLGCRQPAWGDWTEPIVVALLRRETEALVR